jgi:hypothetical protein
MNPLALQARCALAMARVVGPFDVVAAAEWQQRAIEWAADAAWRHEAGAPVPRLLKGEGLLLDAFTAAEAQADAIVAERHAHPAPIWAGAWTPSLDGCRETCACVARARDGYLPGLFTSHHGGDCAPTYGLAVESLERAICIARDLENRWHGEQSAPRTLESLT